MKMLIYPIACLIAFSCHSPEIPPIQTGLEGQKMPSVKIRLTDSTTLLSTEDIAHDGPAVVILFSPNCPYCRAELNDILRNESTFGKTHFYLLTNWSLKSAKAFSNYFHLEKYPNIVVAQDKKSQLLKFYKVTGVPFTAIFDDNRTLRQAYEGSVPASQIRRIVQQI